MKSTRLPSKHEIAEFTFLVGVVSFLFGFFGMVVINHFLVILAISGIVLMAFSTLNMN